MVDNLMLLSCEIQRALKIDVRDQSAKIGKVKRMNIHRGISLGFPLTKGTTPVVQ